MNVDLELQYSCEKIKETLIKDIKKIDRNGEILKMEPFPSPHTMALLANAVYYDGDVDLPLGWQILTTARHNSATNGYVGAVYLNPSLQQVVVSHRGTIPTNIGALYTNFKGVVNTKYSPQMNSAVTFADKIVSVLCEVNEETGAGLKLSITGHSLGGWLSQVTAFTLQNVRRDGDGFTKIHDRSPVRHVHTVTFDTPGCRDMLGKIIDDGYCRYRKTVSPDELDITNYLASPNRINTTGSHVGTIHLVDLDVSNFGMLSKNTPYYNIAIHAMDNFVKAFENEVATREVLDWPVSSGALGGREYRVFHARASHETDYTPNLVEEEQQQQMWMIELRYKTEKVENSCNLRVFSERELDLLYLWSELKAEKVKMTEISAFVTEYALGNVDDIFAEFDIKNRTMSCEFEASMITVIRHAKQLTRWFPKFLEAVKENAQKSKAGLCMYRLQARNYLASLPECRMCFEDTIGLKRFLESGEIRLLHIITEDGQFQVSVVRQLLSQMSAQIGPVSVMRKLFSQVSGQITLSKLEHWSTYLQRDHQTFLDWEKLQDLEKTIDFVNLYKSGYHGDDLLVINLAVSSQDMRIFERFFDNANKKLIIVSSPQCEIFSQSLNVPTETVGCVQFGLDDLMEISKRELFSRKMLITTGKQLALEDYTEIQNVNKILSHINNYTERLVFKKIITDQSYVIAIEDALLSSDDLKVYSTVNKEVSVERVVRVLNGSPDALVVVSGIGREELRTDLLSHIIREENIFTTTGDGESDFKQKCWENLESAVYWLAASNKQVFCKTIYEKGFYIKRQFHKIIFNVEHFVKRTNKSAIFVFQNVENKQTLISRYTISEAKKNVFLTSDHIKTATSDEEVDNIIEENPHRPIHVLKKEVDGDLILWRWSRGSLEDISPYVTTVSGRLIDEKNLCDARQKVVIIADEPGMGKSTTLTSVSRLLWPAWVVRVDLRDFQIAIQGLPTELSLNSVCQFILGDQSGWLRGLLQFCLDKKHKNSRDIYIFFDGFDEIKRDFSPNAEDEVLRLLQYLNNETKARIWVTTRLYRKEILEKALSAFAMRFERISEGYQQEFLTKFWRPHVLLEVDSCGDAENIKLDKCAKYVYDNAKKVLGEDVQNFMGIPLQMRMLAEVCLPWVKSNVKSETDIENTFGVTSVLDLYQRFGRLKYDIYFSDKTGLDDRAGGLIKRGNIEQITEKHRVLALRILFPKFAEEHFDDPEDGWGAELCRVGLVQAGGGGREGVEFIHRTLAEFYCADLVIEWLRKRGRYLGHAPVIELLFTEILLRDSHRVIRIFIDSIVLSEPLSQEANKFNALRMSELWREKQHSLFNREKETGLHIAVQNGSIGIVELLVGAFQRAPEQLIGFLAARDLARRTPAAQDYRTALGWAAGEGRSDMMLQIVGSVERCSYHVILELLLATYVSYSAVSECEIKLLSDYLQGTADHSEIKRAFTRTEEIMRVHIPSFLASVEAGSAARVGEVCRHVENGTEMIHLLLGAGGKLREGNALHRLAAVPRDEGDTILAHITTSLRDHNISAVGRSQDGECQTPLHRAAAAGRLDLVEWLINHGVWVDDRLEIDGETALFRAARAGSLPVARYLIDKRADINIINLNGENLLFAAARGGNLPLLLYLEEKGLDINVINTNGKNLLFDAAHGGNVSLLQYLVEKGLDINIINKKSENLLSAAARGGSLPLLQYLEEKGLDINILNKNHKSLLFDAARSGNLPLLKYLIEKGLVVNDELLFEAACAGKLPIVRFLIEKGLNINILNYHGENLLFATARSGSLPLLRYLIDNGLNVNIVNKRGKNLLYDSFWYHPQVRDFLEEQMAQRGGPEGDGCS